jgi:hypothetical protein
LPSLAETNPYIRDPEKRRRMLEENALASSVFEGARGLKPAGEAQTNPRKRRSTAALKKSE